MVRVLIFDRFDSPIGELTTSEVFALERHEEVNGAHSLEITTTRVLEKGWRILTRDARGKWREHVVYGTDAAHEAGDMVMGTYYCVWSMQHDLMGARTSRMPGVQNPVPASTALSYAIEGTSRWAKGTVTNTNTAGASMYDMDCWEAISVLLANWGGEIDATIEVVGDEITARKVDLYVAQGSSEAKRRFDFAADLKSVHRKVADGPLYCRITPRGKGEQTDDGYGRKVRISSVNGGKDYLVNQAMVDLAKLPDGNGGWEYPTLEVENSECETPQQLKDWALTVIDDYTLPKVSYEVDVLQAAAEGIDMHGASLGDTVHVVDRKFGNGLRLSGRVLAMTVNMLDERDAKLSIGNVDKGLAQVFGDLKERLDTVSKTVWNMNGGTYSTAEYLSELLGRLNGEINATGGYTYITQGQGLRTYDKVVTDPTVGAEADSVVEIKGGTIRIANTRTAQGEWEWKTVFTSGHIASELVTAAEITSGRIESADGDSYWDLDSGQLVSVDADLEGKITASRGNVGGFDIYESELRNEMMSLRKNALMFYRRADPNVSCGGIVSIKGNGQNSDLNGISIGSERHNSDNQWIALVKNIDDYGSEVAPYVGEPVLAFVTKDCSLTYGEFKGGRLNFPVNMEIMVNTDIYMQYYDNGELRHDYGHTTKVRCGDLYLNFRKGLFVGTTAS